jgi:hypothetical protein
VVRAIMKICHPDITSTPKACPAPFKTHSRDRLWDAFRADITMSIRSLVQLYSDAVVLIADPISESAGDAKILPVLSANFRRRFSWISSSPILNFAVDCKRERAL